MLLFLSFQASLLLALVASSRALCSPGPTALSPLSCENLEASQCAVLSCQYTDCSVGAGRRLMQTDASAPAPADGVGATELDDTCIDGCFRRPGVEPESCEDFADLTCPTWAGCFVATDEATSGAVEPELMPVAQPAVDPVSAPVSEPRPAAVESMTPTSAVIPATAVSTSDPSPVTTPPSTIPSTVYCEWVEGFGCLGSAPGKAGEDYMNGRVTMEMCLRDTSDDDTGCTTKDLYAWCADHGFLDAPDSVICLPKGAAYADGAVFARAMNAYYGCRAQVTATCRDTRKYLFDGLNCTACAATAELAALNEGVCQGAGTHPECLALSEPLFPPQPTAAGAAPAPAPSPPRPTDDVGSCAYVTRLGCLATINNGPEGLLLVENRVKLEACMTYNSGGMTGCPKGAASFCATQTFPDVKLNICVPGNTTYDSGRDLIQHYVTYKECRGQNGADCSDARAYLYGGMGCLDCAAWADAAALNDQDCLAKQTKPDCVGGSGHIVEEELGGPLPGLHAVAPGASGDATASDETEDIGDAAVDYEYEVPLEDGGDGEGDDGDDGDGDAVAVQPVTGPATCIWMEGCCCHPTVVGFVGEQYVAARVLLEFCLWDVTDDISGCKSPQYGKYCNEFNFPDIDKTLCLPGDAAFSSGVDLIDALSIYYRCEGLADTTCDLARGFLFEGIRCPNCGQAATLAAPLEGQCKLAGSEVECIEAGASDAETNDDVTAGVQAGAELGELAEIAAQNRLGIPSNALEKILRPPEDVRPTFSVSPPSPPEVQQAVQEPAATVGLRGHVGVLAVGAAIVVGAAVIV
eukprot:jgi/Ulvmu1/11242/UM073_0014.1